MRTLLALVLLAAGACTPKPFFDEKECPFTLHSTQVQGQTIRCGMVHTPEWHHRASGLIQVPVIVFKGGDPKLVPIVNLAGGPSQSWADLGLQNISAETSGKFRTDVIFFEQRGTGKSIPALHCPDQKSDEASGDFLARCAKQMHSDGISVEAYNTEELAADVETMRQVLGYDKLLLSGVSYGTAWALEVMRQNSSKLAGVVLDSVVSPTSPPLSDAAAQSAALENLFAECNAAPACKGKFGDLRQKAVDTLTHLANQPVQVKGSRVSLNAAGFFSLMVASLKASPARVPDFVQRVYDATTSGTLDLGVLGNGGNTGAGDGSALGQYLSVTCSDNQFVTDAEIGVSRSSVPEAFRPYVSSYEELLTLCKQWPYLKRGAKQTAVVSDVPTLILSGSDDPITPPLWAKEVAQTLSQSTFVQIPGVGHDVASWGVECVNSLLRSFYRTQTVDTACVASVTMSFADNPSRSLQSFPLLPAKTDLVSRLPRW